MFRDERELSLPKFLTHTTKFTTFGMFKLGVEKKNVIPHTVQGIRKYVYASDQLY